jgi:hypothetical protein
MSRRQVLRVHAVGLALLALSTLSPTVAVAPDARTSAAFAPRAHSVPMHAGNARAARALVAELRGAGDLIAAVAFADGHAGRRAAARGAANALTARARHVARQEHRLAGDAARLLLDIASALRAYDLARIDALSARRSALDVAISRDLVDIQQARVRMQKRADHVMAGNTGF